MDYPGRLLSEVAISAGKLTGFLIALFVLLLLSAFFSAAETAYTSVNRIRLKNMENNGSKRATTVLKQLDKYDKLLITVLIGNNIVNIAMASIGTVMFAALLKGANYSAAVSTATITVIVLIFGETMPKTIAKDRAEAFAMAISPVMSAMMVFFTPISVLLSLWNTLFKSKKTPTFSGEELITIIEEAENDGEIDEHESELIRSAIEFDDVDVYDIMVPRVEVVAVADTTSMDEIAKTFQTNGYSRLPVYHDTIDAIIGVIHIKDFYEIYEAGAENVSSIIKSSLCVSRNMKISAALKLFQKSKVHLAVVVDEFGGTSGIITLEDILEELVGEIYDEHDEVEVLLRKVSDNTYIVSGSYSLDELACELNMKFDDFESSTVGGWVTELVKEIPVVGKVIDYKNLEITVTKATARKVIELKIVVNEVVEEEDEENKEE